VVAERRILRRRFEDDRLEMVWAALETLDVSLRYNVLRELATELGTEQTEPRSYKGRIRAAIVSLNAAADFLEEPPTQSAYRELRRRHPELALIPETTVRRVLGHLTWQDCLRRAMLSTPSAGDFVKRASGRAFTDEEIVGALQAYASERPDHTPTFADYLAWATDPTVADRHERLPASLSVFIRRGGFRACLERAGFKEAARSSRLDSAGRMVPLARGYTDEEMREAVRSVADALGRSPRIAEYREAREETAQHAREARSGDVPPSYATMINRFGTWNDVLAHAGLPPIERRPSRTGRRQVNARYSKEEMIEWVRKAWIELGAPLTPDAYEVWRRRQLDEADADGRFLQIPTCDTIQRALGGWRRARERAIPEEPA
jgi:Homing endonuclease associated repeat